MSHYNPKISGRWSDADKKPPSVLKQYLRQFLGFVSQRLRP